MKVLVLRASQARPVILLIEDLHWIDAGTQAVLDHLVDSLVAARVLLLLTHRPEYRHEWFEPV
jgi:predicted ATPase